MSHIINKIEVAAAVSNNNNITSEDFPKEIKVYIVNDQVHNFNLKDEINISRDNLKAIILSTEEINFRAEEGNIVKVVWGKNTFHVHIDNDDRRYDHILTDVIHNDRSIKIPKTKYSVCSCTILSGDRYRYADTYITLHTKKE